MAKYPINLDIEGKHVVVIGAGTIAARKVQSLCGAGAKVTVITKAVRQEFTEICKDLDFELIVGEYSKERIASAVLVIASTNDNQFNSAVYSDCRELKILCNVVDVPELCDFYVPAIVQQGPLQVAIGTGGNCPALAAKIRKQLESIITPELGGFADELGSIRKQVIADVCAPHIRKEIFQTLVSDESFNYFIEHGTQAWHSYAESIIRNQT